MPSLGLQLLSKPEPFASPNANICTVWSVHEKNFAFAEKLNQWFETVAPTEKQIKADHLLLSHKNSLVTAINRIYNCFVNKEKELHLHGLGLSTLPNCLTELAWVEKLHLQENHFCTLPDCVHQMTHLSFLNLNRNYLRSLTVDFWENKIALRELHIDHNGLQSFPGAPVRYLEPVFPNQAPLLGIPLAKQPLIRVLSLANNALSNFPESCEHFYSLQELNLQSNRISEFPPALWNSKSISRLNVASNPELKNIPPPPENYSGRMTIYQNHEKIKTMRPSLHQWEWQIQFQTVENTQTGINARSRVSASRVCNLQ